MKTVKWIFVLTMVLTLALTACGTPVPADEATGDSGSSEREQVSSVSTDSSAYTRLLEAAPEDAFFAVVTDLDKDYQEILEAITTQEDIEIVDAPLVEGEDPADANDILIIPVQKTYLTVDEVFYYSNLRWFGKATPPLLSVDPGLQEKDQVIALKTMLTEGIPHIGVTAAFTDGQRAVWYADYAADAAGETDEQTRYITGETPQPEPLDEFSVMVPIAEAFAEASIGWGYTDSKLLRSGGYREKYTDPDTYWYFVQMAVSVLPPDPAFIYDNPELGAVVTVPGSLVDAYKDAMWPNIENPPAADEFRAVPDPETDTYDFTQFGNETVTFEVLEYENNDDGSGASITLRVSDDGMDEDPVQTVKVILEPNKAYPDSPFPYSVTGLEVL
jgi:hypothetical protein